MRPSVLHDEDIYQKLLEQIALGVPQTLVAKALGVHDSQVSRWLKRRNIAKDLALRTLENVCEPIAKVRKSLPLAYLERHPATREAWAPPKVLDQQLTINTINVELPRRLQEQVIDVDVPRLPGVDE